MAKKMEEIQKLVEFEGEIHYQESLGQAWRECELILFQDKKGGYLEQDYLMSIEPEEALKKDFFDVDYQHQMEFGSDLYHL